MWVSEQNCHSCCPLLSPDGMVTSQMGKKRALPPPQGRPWGRRVASRYSGVWSLPGGDEVLGEVDADRGAGDGDVPVTSAVQLAADLDLSAWHLPDFVDLGALSADDWADELWKVKTVRGKKRQLIRNSVIQGYILYIAWKEASQSGWSSLLMTSILLARSPWW